MSTTSNTQGTTAGPRRYETMEQAAQRTQLSVRTIRRFIASGRLTGYRLNQRNVRLDPADVDALFTPTTTWAGGGK
ncbi:helix-turn-helix domain-containing protein [Corynebacterium variabile]|uniref:helix-turn-helix domain-containing protein n=1 Tax=Corynebacterium variabile TaxID=1727 RepID=UPI0037364C26